MINYIIIIAVIILAIVILNFTVFAKKTKPGSIIQKGKTIYLMGECGSGKTALLYKYAKKSPIDSVSSMEINETQVEVDGSEVPIVDIPGQSFFKEKYIKELKYARVIVMVIDSSDKESFPNAADYLYNILIQKDYQQREIPILLALNKQDAPKALKIADFELLFNKEMERIKQSKRAISEESDEIEDFIKHQDQKFSLSENQIKVVECSVQNDEINHVQEFLENNY